jgi:hypothetical protein
MIWGTTLVCILSNQYEAVILSEALYSGAEGPAFAFETLDTTTLRAGRVNW